MPAHGMQSDTYSNAVAVTPSDTANNNFAAFFATGAGNLVFKDLAGVQVTLTALPIYTIMPIACTFIMATGTTSTGIIGLR